MHPVFKDFFRRDNCNHFGDVCAGNRCSTIFAISSSNNGMKNTIRTYQEEIDSYIADIKGLVEVFSLSNASAEASRKTGELLQATKDAVEIGRRLTADTAGELTKGIQSAETSKEHVVQMKKTLSIQQNQIAAIDTLTGEIADVVETNSATAQENAASGSELMTCAQDLKDTVKRFKLS